MLKFHRKEQWDLECWPWLVIAWTTPDRYRRIACLWRGGVELGSLLVTWERRKLTAVW